MKCIYHPGYAVALPTGHPFPISKYLLLKDLVLEAGLIDSSDLLLPDPLDVDSLALIHTGEYLAKLDGPGLSQPEQRRLGLPWSTTLWLRSRLAAGGTLLAARRALCDGLAANLAGGTHHAFADHAEGFCVLNDVAVAIAKLRQERRIQRAAVIDLDVHQGNGTAAIFEHVEEVFTFSMHGERNYPLHKMRSDLDVALDDGTGDEQYLDSLTYHLPQVLERSRPDIAFYLAGVDVAAGDRYGKLALTEQGIRRREEFVINAVRSRGVPLVITLAGGYAASRERTAQLHLLAIRAATSFSRSAESSFERRSLDRRDRPSITTLPPGGEPQSHCP
jgi:acetoin utilization deacetylase AcuC-like enzyme